MRVVRHATIAIELEDFCNATNPDGTLWRKVKLKPYKMEPFAKSGIVWLGT
ncbi:hypothetical protein [Bradyrhizobium sp.]|uniref:hypothetical protein n=1 Tax=Bradyrhizobium sp. TaxID=376 RepID=UPI003C5FAC4B